MEEDFRTYEVVIRFKVVLPSWQQMPAFKGDVSESWAKELFPGRTLSPVNLAVLPMPRQTP